MGPASSDFYWAISGGCVCLGEQPELIPHQEMGPAPACGCTSSLQRRLKTIAGGHHDKLVGGHHAWGSITHASPLLGRFYNMVRFNELWDRKLLHGVY